MFFQLSKTQLLLIGTFATISASSQAQTPADQMAVAYQAARNQLGILMYCQTQGFVDADVIAVQKKILTMLPAPASTAAGDAAEALGKKGTISAMGVTSEVEAMTKAQGSTVKNFCGQIGAAIKQAGSALPK